MTCGAGFLSNQEFALLMKHSRIPEIEPPGPKVRNAIALRTFEG
jgi:hypothetical protein